MKYGVCFFLACTTLGFSAIDVGDAEEFRTALANIILGTEAAGANDITMTASIAVGANYTNGGQNTLPLVAPATANGNDGSITIAGGGNTLSGDLGGSVSGQGFFLSTLTENVGDAFSVAISNLTIDSCTVGNPAGSGSSFNGSGLNSGGGGGGGAMGAGAGILVDDYVSLTLTNVTISNCTAKGGNGGSVLSSNANQCGGGAGGGFAGSSQVDGQGAGGNGGCGLRSKAGRGAPSGSGGGGGAGCGNIYGAWFGSLRGGTANSTTGAGGAGTGVDKDNTGSSGIGGSTTGGAGYDTGKGAGGDGGAGASGSTAAEAGENGEAYGGAGGGGGANLSSSADSNAGRGGDGGFGGGGGGGGTIVKNGRNGGGGGSGGDFGGGGGGGGSYDTGVAGTRAGQGGTGGFGGGGGGAGQNLRTIGGASGRGHTGGTGGFGAGGGGSTRGVASTAGQFGGAGGTGDVGSGSVAGPGGGGAGLGGGIFVRENGSLTFGAGCSFSGNSVIKGSAGSNGSADAEDGSALGADIFLHTSDTSGTVGFAVATGATLSVPAANIGVALADSGGTFEKSGGGTLILTGGAGIVNKDQDEADPAWKSGTISITDGYIAATSGSIDATTTVTPSARQLTLFDTDSGSDSSTLSTGGILVLLSSNSDTFDLGGNYSFTGPTLIDTGDVTISDANAMNDASSYILSTGTTLNSTVTGTLGSLASSGACTVEVTSGTTLSVGNDDTSTTFAGTINETASSASFEKVGSGTWTLTGDLNTTGTTFITEGTLLADASNDNALPSGSLFVVDGTLDCDGNNTIAGLSGDVGGSGTVNIASGKTLTINQSTTQTYAGTIEGAGALVKDGTGTLTLSGTLSYTGGTTLQGVSTLVLGGSIGSGTGDITVSVDGCTVSSGGTVSNNIAVSGDGLGLTLTGSSSAHFSGDISGTNTGISISSGTVRLSGSNSHSTTTVLSGATLSVGSESSLGSGTFTANDGATVIPLGTVNKALTLPPSATLTVSNADGNSGALAGTISGDAASVTKTGAGSVTLSGTNTYDGTTTISAGTLNLSGQIAGNVNVSGGTFAMNGTYASANTTSVSSGTLMGAGTLRNVAQTGGTLAPGNSIGTLNIAGDYTVSNGSIDIEFNGTGGGNLTDLTVVTGATILGENVTLNLVPDLGDMYTEGQEYTFLTTSTLSGTFTTINLVGDGADTLFDAYTVVYNSNNIQLILSEVSPLGGPAATTQTEFIVINGDLAYRMSNMQMRNLTLINNDRWYGYNGCAKRQKEFKKGPQFDVVTSFTHGEFTQNGIVPGGRYAIEGSTAGLSYNFTETDNIGAYFGYTWGRITQIPISTTCAYADSYSLGARGQAKLHKYVGVEFTENFDITGYDMKSCATVGRNVTARTHGFQNSLRGRLSGDFCHKDLKIQPFIGANFTYFHISSYQEEGQVGDTYEITREEQALVYGEAGIMVSGNFYDPIRGTFIPFFEYEQYARIHNDNHQVVATRLDGLRTMYLNIPAYKNTLSNLGGGLKWVADAGYSFFGSANLIIGRGQANAYEVSLGGNVEF